MNVERFFTQKATLQKLLSEGYSGSTYGDEVEISVRKYTENETVISPSAVETVTSARISTTAEIAVGDRITDADGKQKEVIQVRKNYSTRGIFSHNVGWLR